MCVHVDLSLFTLPVSSSLVVVFLSSFMAARPAVVAAQHECSFFSLSSYKPGKDR